MCLAIPARILKVEEDGRSALADIGGIEKTIDVSLIDEPLPDDWVIVHVGFALNRISAEEAEATLKLISAEGGIDE